MGLISIEQVEDLAERHFVDLHRDRRLDLLLDLGLDNVDERLEVELSLVLEKLSQVTGDLQSIDLAEA